MKKELKYIMLEEIGAIGNLVPKTKYKISEENDDYYFVGNVLIPKNLKGYTLGKIII